MLSHADRENGGEMSIQTQRSWANGFPTRFLIQMFDSEKQIAAQGAAFFTLFPKRNRTEGGLELLAAAELRRSARAAARSAAACAAAGRHDDPSCPRQPARASAAVRRRRSRVQHIDFPLADCGQPRAPLRIYELSAVRWRRRRIHLWVPDADYAAAAAAAAATAAAAREGGEPAEDATELGMLVVHRGPSPPSGTCAPLPADAPAPAALADGGEGGGGDGGEAASAGGGPAQDLGVAFMLVRRRRRRRRRQ